MSDLPSFAREQALAMMSLLRQDILLGNDDIERHYEQLGKIIIPTLHTPNACHRCGATQPINWAECSECGTRR